MLKNVVLHFSLSLLFIVLRAQAAAVTYIGALDMNDPNDILMVPVTLATASDVVLRTYSYGGGTTNNGEVISPGSFDPAITLFAGVGPTAIFPGSAFFNDDGTCPPANADPGTLLCLDSILTLKQLPAGIYTAVLSAAGNIPFAVLFGSGTLGDGFTGGGLYDEPPITNYALEINTISAIPEPATITLLGLALAFLYAKRRAARG